MSRFLISLSIAISTLFLLMSNCVFAQTQESTTTTTTTTATPVGTTVEKKTIITTVPAPKEAIVMPPAGSDRCYTVKAGWYRDAAGDVWAADHQVCQYASSPSGVVWVEGYWLCNKYEVLTGVCTNWDWKPAHWESSYLVY